MAVLTIDPARRLADSLSIGELSNAAREVPIAAYGPAPGGRLDAMMLDAKSTFDELVGRMAPSQAAKERILANRYYRVVVSNSGTGCDPVNSNSALITVNADPNITAHPSAATICSGGHWIWPR